ncbi:MAG: flagellar assembly protein FliW [Bryobacteraceae bacterium]
MTQTKRINSFDTRCFGTVEYDENSILAFPQGIPAFEQERRFLAIRQPINEPLVFLQSLSNPDLCFVTLPVLTACPDYRLEMAPEDLEAVELDPDRQPQIGGDVLCLAILSLEENAPPTANLLAPVVVNVRTRHGCQAINPNVNYSHRHELAVPEAVCS